MSLVHANNNLAIYLHRLFAQEKQNVFFSPFSISTAMAMLLCAAEGETAAEMTSALGYDRVGIRKENIASVFEQQMPVLFQNTGSYTLSCANLMLSRKGFAVKTEYKKILADSFKALLVEVDFQDVQKIVNQINEWVRSVTNNMIPCMLQSLDPAVALVLLNAVYFKGTWKKQFDKQATMLHEFYNMGKIYNAKEVHMMHIKEPFPFYEDHIVQALQLPYVGENVAMLILLPHEKDGLESMENSLFPTIVQDVKKKLVKRTVAVTLPRFRMEYTKPLTAYFRHLGINKVFSDGAQLSAASDSPDILISEILHKAVLVVNEEGTEAAAATAVSFCFGGVPESHSVFVADHPFTFFIYDTRSDIILFMGRVNEL